MLSYGNSHSPVYGITIILILQVDCGPSSANNQLMPLKETQATQGSAV